MNKCMKCANFLPAKSGAETLECKYGSDGSSYCIDGQYELFSPCATEDIPEQFIDDEPLVNPPATAQDIDREVFEVPHSADTQEEERLLSLLEGVMNGSIKMESLPEEEQEQLRAFAERKNAEMQEHRAKLAEKIEDMQNRPQTFEQGYNGTVRSAATAATSCKGCDYATARGCFLNKYFDCSANGFYMYKSPNMVHQTVDPNLVKASDDFLNETLGKVDVVKAQEKLKFNPKEHTPDVELDDEFIEGVLAEPEIEYDDDEYEDTPELDNDGDPLRDEVQKKEDSWQLPKVEPVQPKSQEEDFIDKLLED